MMEQQTDFMLPREQWRVFFVCLFFEDFCTPTPPVYLHPSGVAVHVKGVAHHAVIKCIKTDACHLLPREVCHVGTASVLSARLGYQIHLCSPGFRVVSRVVLAFSMSLCTEQDFHDMYVCFLELWCMLGW